MANYRANKIIRKKISTKTRLDLPCDESLICKVKLDDLKDLFNKDLHLKETLEDKAKTNVIGVTISVSLIIGANTLFQNIFVTYGNSVFFWISFVIFVAAVIYMLEAGINSIHVLTAENVIYYPKIGLNEDKQKCDYNLQIGLNRAQNTVRNNFVYTSYVCMRNSLLCLFLVMVSTILPMNKVDQSTCDSENGIHQYEKAVSSLISGLEEINT